MASRPYTFDRVVRIIFTLALIAGAIWLVNVLKDVLLPFCVACLISYFLEPFVQFNRRLLRLKGRVIASFVTLFEMLTFVGIILYFVMPTIISEIGQLSELLRTYSRSHGAIPFFPEELHDIIKRNFNIESLAASLDGDDFDTLIDKGLELLNSSVDFLIHTIEWLLTFIYVIFILIDYQRLVSGFKLLVPPRYRQQAYKLFDDVKLSMDRYFRSQALLALCAAVLYCIGFSIVGIPMAIILGITVGVLYMIPYFQYITVIPVFLVCVITSLGGGAHLWELVGKCALVYVVSQCVCDYVLTPKVMGKALGLNPALILLSLSVWGTLLGIIGMIIALPLTTLLLSYYQQYVVNRSTASPDCPCAKK